MECKAITPFEDIESAHEYLTLLGEAVVESREAVEADLDHERDPELSRRVEALRLVVYKLEKLEKHVTACGRLLNDLRSLRRLLQTERQASTVPADTAA